MNMTIQEATGKTVCESVERLPTAFREDALVLENLGNLERDMKMWGVGT